MKAVITTLTLVIFTSIILESWASPNEDGSVEGISGFVYLIFEDSGLFAVIRDTCLLVGGVLLFDRLWLKAVDSWRLIRYGKLADGYLLPKERLLPTLLFQGIVLGSFTGGLAYVIFTS